MIPNNTSTVSIQGDLGGRRVGMMLDENSLAHLATVLTDLYSDPEVAAIREYATNARDAQDEAGNTDPIQVTTPTPMSPYFKIKDNGVGMSVDDIENIYSKYGASTKRENASANGMLGLGCKAALTYTNSFTLVSVRNGVKVTAVISRQEDGTGVIEIVDTASTNERNGVEISIPVKDRNSFAEKAFKFFSFWKPGTVLVDGKEPTQFEYTLKVNDNLYVNRSKNYYDDNTSYVVMGNVAYPVDSDRITNALGYQYRNYSFVAYVEMGAVNFPPARESLNYTPLTLSTLAKITGQFKAGIGDAALKDISSSATATEAYRKIISYGNLIPVPSYKGQTVSVSSVNSIKFVGYQFSPNAHRYATQHVTDPLLNLERVDAVWVKNYVASGSGVSAVHKRKIRKYMEDNGIHLRNYVYLGEKAPVNFWMDDVNIVDWSDISSIKLLPTTSSTSSSRPASTWDYYDATGFHQWSATLPKGKKIHVSPAEGFKCAKLLTFFSEPVMIVSLSKNRWEKFARDHGSVHVSTYARALAADLAEGLTDDYLEYASLPHGAKRLLEAFRGQKIDDPSISKEISVISEDFTDMIALHSKIISLCSFANISQPARAQVRVDHMKSPFDGYPLVDARFIDHSVKYINAIYAEGNK